METNDIEHYRHRLVELRVEHRDLDDVITRLAKDPLVDELELKRLKKRKLMLKDKKAGAPDPLCAEPIVDREIKIQLTTGEVIK
jgi:hypothetical protein